MGYDLNGKLWAKVKPSGWKIHAVPASLLEGLLQDARERGHTEITFAPAGTEDIMIDLPGMCMVDRTYQEIRIDTLSLSIPTTDFTVFFNELGQAPKRKFANGQEYYKIHGWLACVVFTPEQRDLVLKSMTELMPVVSEAARKEDEEFERRLAQVNKQSPVKVVARPRNSQKVVLKNDPIPKGAQLSGLPSGEKN